MSHDVPELLKELISGTRIPLSIVNISSTSTIISPVSVKIRAHIIKNRDTKHPNHFQDVMDRVCEE
ncbi:hypothetical protein FRC03_009697 [Tulasnella sp. 419]|nr:hypothetical protein FRC03_009697 [Tulasnella sp. 419]